MIGIIVATHGDFARGILDGMELICGRQEKVIPFGLRIVDDVEEFAESVTKKARELDDGDGVLILVDFIGGSPANIAGKLLLGEEGMEALSGMNFPMLVEAVKSREEMNLKELTEQCRIMGTMGIADIRARMEKLLADDEDSE